MTVGQGPEVAVGAIVLTPEPSGTRVLMVQRGRAPMLGRWSLPGGHVQWGEALKAAVAREVFEEAGVEIVVEEFVDVVEIFDEGYHYVVLDYRCVPTDASKAPEPGDDALDARYVLPSELPRLGASDAVMRVVGLAIAARATASFQETSPTDGGRHEP